MSGRSTICRQVRSDCGGAAAAEFALVLPMLILFLFGIIDVGRYMWAINQLEKATQVGARMAIVTNMIPGGLAAANYASTLGQGAQIPTSSFGTAQCTKSGGVVTCSCAVSPCPTLTPYNTAAFDAIATRMRSIIGTIGDQNITITYANSGLGYAGDPNGSDVAPIVTVTTANVGFVPFIFQFFGGRTTLPSVSASLTLEDGAGTYSN